MSISTQTLTERLRAYQEGFDALLALWEPTFPSAKWDKRPTWDNWNKTGEGKPWDNRPTWDNWDKK